MSERIPDPATADEYNAKFKEGTDYFGTGLATGMNVPCPFCAAPGFMSYKILDVKEAMEAENVCKNCGRGTRTIFTHSGHSTLFEIVQTCGEDAPTYLPKIRRV